MDWQRLLKKYMAFVIYEEGISYVHLMGGKWSCPDRPQFNAEEVEELKDMDQKIREERYNDLRP